jgi:hypothetical protein
MAKKLIFFILPISCFFLFLFASPKENPSPIPQIHSWRNRLPLLSSIFSDTSRFPAWWEINIHLSSHGHYLIKQAETSFSGDYSFRILWTGCMERDGQDFLIYHQNWELQEWNILESTDRFDSSRSLSTASFSKKPEFDFNYILVRGDKLHFDFLVQGFSVPEADFPHKFPLRLAATKENSERNPEMGYNTHIQKGSNRIFLDRHDILDESVQKSFHWSWKNQKWQPIKKATVFFSHDHDVTIELSIISH